MSIHFQSKHKSGFTVNSPFHAMTFPAGEAHISVANGYDPADYLYHIADIRGHDPQDLFTLAMWENLLGPEAKKILILPYLPGARADRGAPLGSWVYANFLNGLFLDQIITLDPHSTIMPALFNNSEMLGGGGNNLTIFPFERIIRKEIQSSESDERPQPYDGVIAPDKGAVGRAQRAATVMGVPLYKAEKTRDFATGKLSGFHMVDSLPDSGRLLIVDDICDGGGTFMGLAEAIYKASPDVVLDLWVTHGVFSKGFGNLIHYFSEIHTTDSYYTGSEATVHKLAPYLYGEINV